MFGGARNNLAVMDLMLRQLDEDEKDRKEGLVKISAEELMQGLRINHTIKPPFEMKSQAPATIDNATGERKMPKCPVCLGEIFPWDEHCKKCGRPTKPQIKKEIEPRPAPATAPLRIVSRETIGDFAAGARVCAASGRPCQFSLSVKQTNYFGNYERCGVDYTDPQEVRRWDKCPYEDPVFERMWGKYWNAIKPDMKTPEVKKILRELIQELCRECKDQQIAP